MNHTLKNIPIACSLDRNLLTQCIVMLGSLSRSAQEDTFYDVYILYSESGLNFAERDFLEANSKRGNISVNFVSVGKRFENTQTVRGITSAAYHRLVLGSLIPQLDKILYLDIDVVVLKDLNNLYSSPMNTCVIAGVRSAFSLNQTKYLNELGLSPNSYVNSGVLLMNLCEIRRLGLEQDFLRLIPRNFKFLDQDVLNIICKDKIHFFHPRFNVHAGYPLHESTEQCQRLYGDTALEAVTDPCIVHYAGEKPWNSFNCMYSDLWWAAYRKTPVFDPIVAVREQSDMVNKYREILGIVNNSFWLKFSEKKLSSKIRLLVSRTLSKIRKIIH